MIIYTRETRQFTTKLEAKEYIRNLDVKALSSLQVLKEDKPLPMEALSKEDAIAFIDQEQGAPEGGVAPEEEKGE